MRRTVFLVLADVGLVAISGGVAFWLVAFEGSREGMRSAFGVYQTLIMLASLAYPLVVRVYGGYERKSQLLLAKGLLRVVSAWSTVVALMLGILWANKMSGYFSRMWLGLWVLQTAAIIIVAQWVYFRLNQALYGRFASRLHVIVVGDDQHAAALCRDAYNDPMSSFIVEGYFGRADADMPVPWLGTVDDLLPAFRESSDLEIDELWIMQSQASPELGQSLFESGGLRLYQLRFVPSFRGFEFFGSELERLGRHTLIGISISPQRGVQAILKRTVDLLGAGILLVLLSPLLAFIAMAIRLDSSGPIFFQQQRHGLRGKLFTMWKFRTMFVQHSNPEGRFIQVTQADPRVTPVGRWLRSWSLDELPQLWNVLLGEMSLVGPRPHAAEMNRSVSRQDFRYHLRHKVLPGLTGWAQVKGFRGETRDYALIEARLEHDLYYIEHWTLWLDLRILIWTPFVALTHPNAY